MFQNVALRVSSKHFLILSRVSANNEAQIGIIVAKKHVKLAVQRNRIKRLLRESFRYKRESIPKLEIVILAKKGVDRLENKACHEELEFVWRKLARKFSSID